MNVYELSQASQSLSACAVAVADDFGETGRARN